jgi:hypothetical protein
LTIRREFTILELKGKYMKILIYGVELTLILLLTLGCVAGQTAETGKEPQQFKLGPADIACPNGFPCIGKWMISPEMTYASWLGEIHDGKRLREPINVVIIDPFAKSTEDAVKRFLAACAKAGFTSRPGHSGGYFGWIGDRLYSQIPSEKHHAIADEPFEFHNNHGRFFGPCFWAGRYYFIGALSREKMDPVTRAEHLYVSFNQARDRFARGLTEKGGFKITAFLELDNALLDDPEVGTGDHDGVAVVLTAARQLSSGRNR